MLLFVLVQLAVLVSAYGYISTNYLSSINSMRDYLRPLKITPYDETLNSMLSDFLYYRNQSIINGSCGTIGGTVEALTTKLSNIDLKVCVAEFNYWVQIFEKTASNVESQINLNYQNDEEVSAIWDENFNELNYYYAMASVGPDYYTSCAKYVTEPFEELLSSYRTKIAICYEKRLKNVGYISTDYLSSINSMRDYIRPLKFTPYDETLNSMLSDFLYYRNQSIIHGSCGDIGGTVEELTTKLSNIDLKVCVSAFNHWVQIFEKTASNVESKINLNYQNDEEVSRIWDENFNELNYYYAMASDGPDSYTGCAKSVTEPFEKLLNYYSTDIGICYQEHLFNFCDESGYPY